MQARSFVAEASFILLPAFQLRMTVTAIIEEQPMLVSAFTPTHDPRFLGDVYACLLAQTYSNWEWVVVPNGDQAPIIAHTLAEIVGDDSRVRVSPFPDSLPAGSIGALKKFACENCRGELFLEYDHDDLITEDCFEQVVKAAADSGPNAFIYSDDVSLDEQGASRKYNAAHGWTHYPWVYQRQLYFSNHSHAVHARSLCEILYSPDHVRVWKREAYSRAGGHDPSLRLGDDHELLVRTYLAGAEFRHIRRPLYIHRLRVDNTSQPRIAEIQRQSHATRDRFLYPLVAEWCRREQLPMYDLGGAHGCPQGYVPVDEHLVESQGLKLDVLSPEFDEAVPDHSAGCFRAHDFFEHIAIGDVVPLMNLLYRKLAPGGWILSHTPAVCDADGKVGRGAFQDPTHRSFWSENNWWYFTDSKFAKYVPEIRCRFQAVRLSTWYPSDWHLMHRIPYVIADLCALKEQNARWPGPVLI